MLNNYSRSNAAMGRLELILIVAFCAVAVALALPHLQRTRVEGGERIAAQNMRSLAAAQIGWRLEVMVDQDADREGEFGLLGELAGELIPRLGERRADPPFARPAFATGGAEGEDGCAVTQGYVYRVFLVEAVTEDGDIIAGDDLSLGGTRSEAGEMLSDVDAVEMQERHFAIYAWPAEAGAGSVAYFINEDQQLYATEMESTAYSGRGKAGADNTPAADAAFTGAPFISEPADGVEGNDGNIWRRLD